MSPQTETMSPQTVLDTGIKASRMAPMEYVWVMNQSTY